MGLRSAVVSDVRLRRLSRKALFALQPGARRWYAAIDGAFQDGRWTDVIDLIEAAVVRRRVYMSPVVYTKLAQSHACLGDFQQAVAALERGARTFSGSIPLARARGELAMVMQDWPGAVRAWTVFDEVDDPACGALASFPKRGSDFKWFDQSWITLADHWPETAVDPSDASPDTLMRHERVMVRVVETLRSMGAADAAITMSERFLHSSHKDSELVAHVCEAIIRLSEYGSVEAAVAGLTARYPIPEVHSYARSVEDSQAVFCELLDATRLADDEIRILGARRGSGLAGAVFASQFWTEVRIHDTALRLARRDHWPEGAASEDRLSWAAWHQARRFSRGRGRRLGIDDDDVARAVFHNVKHELVLKIPIDRIADEIAESHDGMPVFIDLSSVHVKYLAAYPWSRFGPVYLYDALRRRGLPVYFVRFPGNVEVGADATEFVRPLGPTLQASSLGSGLKPSNRVWAPLPGKTTDLVVTSGIRSVTGLLERIGDAVVLNSGAPLKTYAYDRSFRQGWGYPVHSSVHPRGGLARVKIRTETRDAWIRSGDGISRCEPESGADVEAVLSFGQWPLGSWEDLLAQSVMPYFVQVVKRARSQMAGWGTTDVHIGDYLYVEPALVAAVAKQRGARIHVWPHSSNPVHVQWHAHGRISTVRAVTRSGVKLWRTQMPDAVVIHDPSLLVATHEVHVPWTENQPVSLVIVGGRPVMRDLPILDLEAHEQLYRRFFSALEPLVESGRLRVYFKPRGFSGENEAWLGSVVGNSASWQTVLEHPLRVNLPNPIFGSVSVGSTALIEGISRGIPGLIVREGFVRDYLAIEEGGIPVFTASQAADWLENHAKEAAWNGWRADQVSWLEHELDT